MKKSRSAAKKELANALGIVLGVFTPEEWIKHEPPCMKDAKREGDQWIVNVFFEGHQFDIKATSDSFHILEEVIA